MEIINLSLIVSHKYYRILKSLTRYLFLFIAFPLFQLSSGQREGNTWIFGMNAGLNFNTFPPQPFDLPKFPYKIWDNWSLYNNQFHKGLSTISDSSGNLLYFAEGSQAWNKEFDFLQNGDSLLGPNFHPCLFVHSTNRDKIMIVQAYRDFSNIGKNSGAYYSLIDPSMDNSKGAITLKNVAIGDSLLAIFDAAATEKKDTILFAFVKGGSDQIDYIETRPNGLQYLSSLKTGRYFKLGTVNTFEPTEYGQMKFSSNGKKLAVLTNLNKEILIIDQSNGYSNSKIQS
ncbi:MAG: hypothetical protein LPK45_04960, partial [Bacteroidota bacterium]|nr:hypothetical protein [Bacteroidota bacterium]MDX5430409.1 hypothetical protein [Bacteroidota bacterium]MDX5469168.1 hypothetical protein [Bacteroidota bacterium]